MNFVSVFPLAYFITVFAIYAPFATFFKSQSYRYISHAAIRRDRKVAGFSAMV
jgi:hypothetical protein